MVRGLSKGGMTGPVTEWTSPRFGKRAYGVGEAIGRRIPRSGERAYGVGVAVGGD
jgi:hypothetical protein